VRVTTNPRYWVLAFVAPSWLLGGIAMLGLAVTIYARISLGRNIGLIPAQRRLVTGGAYGPVRHPIYTGVFLNYLASLFAAYSDFKVVIVGLGVTRSAVILNKPVLVACSGGFRGIC